MRATRATGRASVPACETAPSIGGIAGGRFWALAESDEDDADDDGESSPAESPPSPTPSDLICEFFSFRL